jgi:hypothetical protein
MYVPVGCMWVDLHSAEVACKRDKIESFEGLVRRGECPWQVEACVHRGIPVNAGGCYAHGGSNMMNYR